MSTGNTEFIRNAMSKELIFTMGFSVVASFISDFLQPLANITFYVLILGAALSALFLLLYLIKKDIRKKLSKYLMASITLMALSGFLYSAQDESNSQKGVLAANFPALGSLQQDLGMLEKDIAEIKESTLRTEQLVESIAEDSKENIKQTKELTETIKDSNEAIVNKLDEINDSFQEISKLGGIIADPKRPEEFYSNARVYEDRGDYLNARRMYNQYFTFKLDYIDPHLRYQTFLKVQEGRAGALETYNYLYEINASPTLEFARILLFDSKKRIQLLEQYIQKNKDFAPAYYELSKEYSASRLGVQSLSDQQKEFEYLSKFLEMNNEGKFLRYFIDHNLASTKINNSKERFNALRLLSEKLDSSRVTSSVMVGSSFIISLGFKEEVKEIFYKTSKQDDYKTTGLDSYISSTTGELAIKKSIELPLKTKQEVISIKYLDINDTLQGPYEIEFDSKEAFTMNAKNVLSSTKASWVSFRHFDWMSYDDERIIKQYGIPRSELALLYITHLQTYKCGISEIKIGIDKDVPDKVAILQKCDPMRPFNEIRQRSDKYINIQPEKHHPCWGTIMSNKRKNTNDKCIDEDLGSLQVSEDTEYITVKVTFLDGEEMVEKFYKSDNMF